MKLDKYDRMFIAFMFVVVTFISICNCVYAEEGQELFFSSMPGYSIVNFKITEESGKTLVYINITKGHNYRIYNTGYEYNYFVYKGDSLDVGESVQTLASNSSIPLGRLL